jgi:AhpD family alkylhydroperoxidase
MVGLQRAVNKNSLDPKLMELIKYRASQINGYGYCLDMHSKDARAIGETEQRIYLLSAWREAPFYTEKERAALAWCESLTLVSQTGAPDEVFEKLEKVFSPEEITELTFAIAAINSWNRLSIGHRAPVGEYTPASKVEN